MQRILFAAFSLLSIVCATPRHHDVDWKDRLGYLARYNTAPSVEGIRAELPNDCKVNQVMLMGRHGSRLPTPQDLSEILNMTYSIGNQSSVISKIQLPDELAFLKHGYKSELGHDGLTSIGRQQLFNHGASFRRKYSHLQATQVLAGQDSTVVESAQWFALGYFGLQWSSLNDSRFSVISEDNTTESRITPYSTCPNWAVETTPGPAARWKTKYLPPITERLKGLLPGVNLTDEDVHGALLACPYDLAAYGTSPWCQVFKDSELEQFAYEIDLNLDWYSFPNDMGAVLGSLYVQSLIKRFANVSSDNTPVYLEFGHAFTIIPVLNALGLSRDKPPLPPQGPVPANRKWRTDELTPFGAQMIWERFSCSSSFQGPQIRLILNDAIMPLTSCANSKIDNHYGTCSMEEFANSNHFSTSIEWRDARWNSTCGGG